MKLISFDVGLRNLAYCVLQGTSRSDVQILDWGIIDVLAEQSGLENPRCFKCSQGATWRHATDGTLACSRHKPKTKAKVTKSAISKLSVEEIQAELDKHKLVCPSKKKQDKVTVLYLHHRQNTWLRCVKTVHTGAVMELAPSIKACLDRRAETWKNADLACFENQPERKMFAVQAMLQMYFCCRGFVCQGVSAAHKLNNIITVEDRVDSYKGRKKTGIVHAEALVPEVWKAHLLKHPKKDDLADSFLQGLWVLEHTPKTTLNKVIK
jgi:hypothetical protein